VFVLHPNHPFFVDAFVYVCGNVVNDHFLIKINPSTALRVTVMI
jgi:hypothetical protein